MIVRAGGEVLLRQNKAIGNNNQDYLQKTSMGFNLSTF